MRATWVVTAVVIAAGSGTAGAESTRVDRDDQPHLRAHVSVAGEMAHVADVSMSSFGVEPLIAYRVGPIVGFVRASAASGGETATEDNPDPRGANIYRYGGGLRLPVHTLRLGSDGQVSFWLEAGAGRRVIRWKTGGVLRRAEGSFGAGFDFRAPVGHCGGSTHFLVITAGARAAIAAPAEEVYGNDPGVVWTFGLGYQR